MIRTLSGAAPRARPIARAVEAPPEPPDVPEDVFERTPGRADPELTHDAQQGLERLKNDVDPKLLDDLEKAMRKAKTVRVPGPVFRGGPNVRDVDQGQHNDCALMAALAAIAKTDPEYLKRMIKKNDDGTYSVTFRYRTKVNGKTVWRTHTERVTPDFRRDGADPTPNNQAEIWVALIEKAYAQWKGGYGPAYKNGGFPGSMMELVTGRPTRRLRISKKTTNQELADFIRKAVKNGHPLTFYTNPKAEDVQPPLVAWHSYAILDIRTRNGKTEVLVYNPWGPDDRNANPPVWIPIDKLRRSVPVIAANDG